MKTLKLFILIFLIFNYIAVYGQTRVTNISELSEALQKAYPGDEILLSAANFSGKEIKINANGLVKNPIVIKAEYEGKTTITCPVNIEGNFIHISGIGFAEGGKMEIKGKGCKIVNCKWDDVQTGKWIRILPGSSNIEIANCTFRNKSSNLNFPRDCQLMQIVVLNKNEQHHIHHNLFENIPKGIGNGFETLQLITKGNPFDPPPGNCNSLVEDNLFLRCDGESEIISIKSNGNLIRRNTFRDCFGGLVLRHGDDNIATQNYFLGENKPGSAGIRIQGSGQMVANNYFQDLENYGLGMMDGTPDDLYIQVEGARILFNTFANCENTFVIGINHSRHPNGTTPKNCSVIGNIFYSDENRNNDGFIDFVQNDQPENWEWHGNLAFGKVSTNTEEIELRNPYLDKNNIYVPGDKTPKVRITEIPKNLGEDLFGKSWELKRTVGAIQFPYKKNKNQVLTNEMVGCNF